MPRWLRDRMTWLVILAAIAAAVVIALAVGGYYMMHQPVVIEQPQPKPKPPGPGPVATRGYLLLSASPYGEIEKIVSADGNQSVDLSDEKKSTPTRIELDPGKYLVTVNSPDGKQATIDVNIQPGKATRAKVPGSVDLDQLEKDMNKQ